MRLTTADSPTKTRLPKRLALGFAALASAAVVGVAGLAGATPMDKPTKDACKRSGFSNYGHCVRDWAQNRNPRSGPGTGYGGGNSNEVNTEVNLEVNGDNNVINVVINYVFG